MNKSRFYFTITQSAGAVKGKPKATKGSPTEPSVDVLQNFAPAPEGVTVYRAVAAAKQENRNRWYKLNVGGIQIGEFAKNPVIMLWHNYQSFPVGRAVRAYFEDGKSKLIIEFILSQTNPDAIQAAALIEEGILRSVSVGLHVLKTSEETGDDRLTLEVSELLELSFAPVAADSDALLQTLGSPPEIATESVDDVTVETLNYDIEELKERLAEAESTIQSLKAKPAKPAVVKLSPELENQINQAFPVDAVKE